MSLLNFVSKQTKDKIKENAVKSIELKDKELLILTEKNIKENMTPEQAKAEAEIQLFKPKPLPQIELEKTNINSGKRIKIFFFATEEEYKKIVEKFKMVSQCDELRIASSATNEFINKILEEE